MFIEAVNNEISDSQIRTIPRDNLAKEERRALRNLQNRESIFITKADMGGAGVIWDTKDYIIEGNRQLNDGTIYKKTGIESTRFVPRKD